MAKIVKNSLGYLGVDFQYKLISAFINDGDFFRDLSSIIDQNMFTETYLRTIVGIIKEYFNKYNSVPDYEMLTIKLNGKATTEDERQYYSEAVEKLRSVSTAGYREIEDMAEKFFKQQNWLKVSNEIKRVVGDGDLENYDELMAVVNEAMSIGRREKYEYSPFESIEDDLSPENVVTIPTGVDKLDEGLGGGLDKGKVGLIICPMGAGKALPDDELVATPNGFTEIKNIKVGDYVIGSNGKPTIVTGVFPQGERDIYKVTFSDGASCRCDKEHLWTVNTWKQRHLKHMRNGVRKHYIDNSFSTTKTLGELMECGFRMKNHHNEHQFRIPICKPVEYINKTLSIDPYLMGYMIGDGTFERTSISIGEIDEGDFINQLNKLDVKYKVYHHSNRTPSVKLYEPFRSKLKTYYGDEKILSNNKYIHSDYLYNSLENRIALLNGLMDSDGYCDKRGRCSFSTKSKQLAEDVRQLVLSLGGFANISEKKVSYTNKKYNEKRDCGTSYNVSISLCDNTIPVFRYERKQSRVVYRSMKATERYFEKAEYVGKQNAICIKVAAEDELFLTKDYIVTHNTSMTTCIAAYAASYKCAANNYQGYKVLQICFEDKPRDLRRKYISKVSKVETSKLNESKDTTAKVLEILHNSKDLDAINNNVKILKLVTGEVTATDIKNEIIKKANEGFKADLVIVDYFECVDSEPGTGKLDITTREGKTMRKFEAMAEELDIALWVPTQGNRDSITTDLVTNDKVGGSIRKNQIAQVVLSITRSVEDIKNKRAAIAILKNRSGGAGLVLNGVLFDNGTCTIQCDGVVTFDSPLLFSEHEEEAENKRAQQEHAEFFVNNQS